MAVTTRMLMLVLGLLFVAFLTASAQEEESSFSDVCQECLSSLDTCLGEADEESVCGCFMGFTACVSELSEEEICDPTTEVVEICADNECGEACSFGTVDGLEADGGDDGAASPSYAWLGLRSVAPEMLEEFLVLLLLGFLALVTAWIRNLSALPDTTGISIGTLGNVQSYQARKRAAEQRVANVVKNIPLDEEEGAMVTNVSVSAVPATALSYPRQFVVPVSSPLKPYLVPRSPMILTRSESFVRLQRRRKLEKRKEGDLEEEEEAARKRREQDRRERREKMRRKRERERQFARREEQREEVEEAKGEEEELFRELCGAVRENNVERVGELLQAAESSFNITAEKKNDNEGSRRKKKERRKKRQKETSRDEKESGEGEAEEEAEPTETAEDGAVMFRAKIVAPTSDSDDEEAETEEEERQLVEDLDDVEEEEEENEGVEDEDDENGGAQLLSQLLSRKEETFGETLVHIAAANGSEEVLRLLLSKGASPNATDENGNTPLHSASGEGHSGCCQLLVDAGAEVNAVDHSRGNTPLHRCVEPDDFPECCAILLDQHAQVDLPNHQGMTALHKAAAAGSLECMDLLLKAGASPAVEDAEGNTPLHAAASSLSGNAMEACMMLVGGPQGARADLKARNRAGQAPKGVARTRGNEELVVLLLEMEWRQPVKQGEKQQRTEDIREE
ncbi:Serine/threonine-protein phosphatase 6 regulatory ankyrin repeat subunit C-like [Balamuthia mandrillaris]